MAFDVKLDLGEWVHAFALIADNTSKIKNHLQAAANTIGFRDIVGHFDDEMSPDGKWEPRSQKTNEAYDKRGGAYRSSNKLLQLTGELRKSIIPGTGQSKIIGQGSVKMFAGTDYSRTHDEGDSSRNIPQREFMWISADGLQDITDYLIEKISSGL